MDRPLTDRSQPAAGGAGSHARLVDSSERPPCPAPTHTRGGREDRRRRLPAWPLTIAVVAVAAIGVGAVAVATRTPNAPASAAPTVPSPARTTTPFAVGAIAPADQTTGVPSDATITVDFTRPLSTASPAPTLTPPVAGAWQQVTPTTLAFVASAPLVPLSTETVTVPAGPGGVVAAGGGWLEQPRDGPLHRGRGQHPAPAAAPRPARLPPGGLHAGRSAGRPPGGGAATGGHLRLAVRPSRPRSCHSGARVPPT